MTENAPFGRARYRPAYGDDKDRQAIASASVCQFGRDLTYELVREERHRAERTGSPNRPRQPRYDARLKTWRRRAAEQGRPDVYAELDARVKAQNRSQRRKTSR